MVQKDAVVYLRGNTSELNMVWNRTFYKFFDLNIFLGLFQNFRYVCDVQTTYNYR